MRSRATAATARGDEVDPEAGLSAAGGVSAPVVGREELDVLMKFPAVDLVLDSVVGEMHVIVEVPQIVVACPVADLVFITTGSAVTVGTVAVVVLQELLIFPLEVLFEDDASDLEDVVLFSEPSVLLPKGRVKIRIVVDLARAAGAGVEPLRRFTVSLQRVGLEQVTAFRRKGQPAFTVAKLDGLHEPLIVEVVECVARKIQVVFRRDPKGADGG